MKNFTNFVNNTKTTQPLIVGNGIWDWIKPAETISLKVEDLYKDLREDYWWILDSLFVDRPDLQERIEKYKKSRVA